MRCPGCNAKMVLDTAYDPAVWKCPECRIEVEEEGYAGDVPCLSCGRFDLPLHTNGKCPECAPTGP